MRAEYYLTPSRATHPADHQGLEAASIIEARLGADSRPRPRRKSGTGSSGHLG